MGVRQRAVVALLVVATTLPGGTALAANHVVEVRDSYYEPATLTVPAGTTVVWHQVEYLPHTVTATDGSWDSHPECGNAGYEPCMYYDDRYERTFAQPGTYDYYCRIHGTSMSGTVVVTAGAVATTPPPSPSPTAPSPSPTAPSPSPSPSPTTASPTVTSSPTTTPPAATTPPPSPTPSASPSDPEPSAAPPSSEPTSPEPTSEPTLRDSPSPTLSASETPLGAPADDAGSGGRAVVIVLVALVAGGLGIFGWSQLRPAPRQEM